MDQDNKSELMSRIKELEIKIDDLQDLNESLADGMANNFFETVQMLASICALLEKYYEGSHSRFVSDKSEELAIELGMSETDAYEIKIAGLLHDIGKAGFRDTLMFKYYNEMNQTERKRYYMHPKLGMEILNKYSGFDSISEIVYQHHERIDGSGFPRHLQVNNIHPGAAIIAIVDYYHNSMFRNNRDKLDSEINSIKYSSSAAFMETSKDKFASAMNYMNQKKGVLFDRKAVDVFMEILRKDRMKMGKKSVMRIPVNNIEPGMIFAEDYYTSFGLLIAAKGETTKKEMVKMLTRFAENGDIPYKILVMK